MHILAGCLILHQVSVQSAAGASQAATAAADQPLEPQGILDVHHGLIGFLNAEDSVVDHIANSSIATFQSELAQCLTKFSITVALYGGLKSANIFEDAVVGTQISQNMSFIAKGTHINGQSILFNQFSLTKLYACILSSNFSILFKKYEKTSSLVISLDFNFIIISSKLKSLKLIYNY